MTRKAFTLVELIVVIVLGLIVGGIAISGIRGCTGAGTGQGSLITNPYKSTESRIQVIRADMAAANSKDGLIVIYRVGTIVLSGYGAGETETFEIRDSLLDANFSSADLYMRLIEGKIYDVTCRGERSGILSVFRGITSVEEVVE